VRGVKADEGQIAATDEAHVGITLGMAKPQVHGIVGDITAMESNFKVGVVQHNLVPSSSITGTRVTKCDEF
jgi:hypothetical protein